MMDSRYIIKPIELVRDRRLTSRERDYLCLIASLENCGQCNASNQYFADYFGVERPTAVEFISKLKKKGFISTEEIKSGGKTIKTKLRKFGALIGDNVETGCNSVLNPGVVLSKGCMVYPCVAVKKGIYPSKSLIRSTGISRLR